MSSKAQTVTTCADNCEGEIPIERPRLLASPPVRASLLSWLFVAAAFAAARLGAPAISVTALWAASILAGAFYFARDAVEGLMKEREVGIELLMTCAIAGAAVLGNWREGALVAALYSITEALEGFTIQRTRFAIRSLMDLVPKTARVLRESGEVEVPVDQVVPGERVQIRPGEAIPVDGVIRSGSTAIDESAVTGESMPVERGEGDSVFAGTFNGNGALVVEATKLYSDNVVSKIIHLVEQAQQQKGKSQLFVERFGRIYSPSVLGITGLLLVVPWACGASFVDWAHRAVSFLVAASPCALAVATPVTLVAGIGAAARRGVLIKGGAVLEAMGKVKAVALDKTGTLTFGKPEVTGLFAVEGDEARVLSLAAAVEHYSEHPLASAIVRAARARNVRRIDATDFRALTAAGVEGVVEGARVSVLKPKAALERGVAITAGAEEFQAMAQGDGKSVVAVVGEGRLEGLIAMSDTLRPEAAALVQALKKAGVAHVVMLTGDNEGSARAVAAQVGIEEYYAGLLPEDKVERVKALERKYQSVAMIGDGINDAPALAVATVGIAMGTGGSDAAIAAADIALVGDDLGTLAYSLKLGARSRRIIRQNVFLSLVVVVVLVAGTLTAAVSMIQAVLGHEGSEVLIIINGLRAALL